MKRASMKCTGHDDTFVVELQMEKVAMSKAPLFMYFVLDASASMDANERLTSMHHRVRTSVRHGCL
jgi:Mg-chelatase subunit ChlD